MPHANALGSCSGCMHLAASEAQRGRVPRTQLATALLPRASSPHEQCRLQRPARTARGRGARATSAVAQSAGAPSHECHAELSRRRVVLGAVAAAGAALTQGLPLWPNVQEAKAAEGADSLTPFENATDGYTLLVPADWSKGDGTVGTRKLVAWHPTSTTQTNVSLLLTPLGADFTSLGSFGTVEAFGESLVNGLDRSYLRKPGQRAELLSATKARDLYLIEYTLQKPGEDKVHLMSAVGVHFNGIYNQLYTLTAQYMEEDASSYEKTIRAIVDSFNIVK